MSESPHVDAVAQQTVPHPGAPGERVSYTLQNASEVIDLSIATLRRLNKAGRLRFIKVGGRTLVDARSLHALIA
jgi:excisionase family DNA binding protein